MEINEDVRSLIRDYDTRLDLTGTARTDIPHFAFAVSYNMDYLVTWNCSHIANGHVIRRLTGINDELNRKTPVIVTPEELINLPGDLELLMDRMKQAEQQNRERVVTADDLKAASKP